MSPAKPKAPPALEHAARRVALAAGVLDRFAEHVHQAREQPEGEPG